MIPTVYSLGGASRLCCLQTQTFKSSLLSVSAVLPIDPTASPMTTLLLSVLRRGTEKYPTLAAINSRLDYLFGTELSIRNFYRGDSQIIGFGAELLDASYVPDGEELLDGILEVMTEILFHPLLDGQGNLLEKYVESEKKLQCEAIRAQKNNPRAYAGERCRSLVYCDEPCGASPMGSEEQIMRITPEELTRHWRALISSLRLDFFYVGRTAPEELLGHLTPAFAPFVDPKEGEALSLYRSVPRPKEKTLFVDEDLEVAQGQLLLALRTPVTLTEPEFWACMLFNEILGASPISKLFMNVRERLGLCYHCSSSYNVYKGCVTVSCGLEPSNRAQAQKEILLQIKQIQRGRISDEELGAAVKSLQSLYRQLSDSPAAMENFYYGRMLAGLCASAEEGIEAFARVTKKEIAQVARACVLDTVYFLNGKATEGGEDDDED